MTDATPEATPAATSQPAGDAAPAAPSTPSAATTEPAPFQVPEAYKDKPWVSKVKTLDDAFKQIDNLDTLVGKKHRFPDHQTATPQELDEYYNSLRPAEKTAYKMPETFDAAHAGDVGDMLHLAGLSEHQASKLLPAYEAFEKKRMEEATSADGFKDVMTKNFGEKYDALVVSAQNAFKELLTPEQRQTLDVIPNAFLAPVYAIVQKYEAKLEAIKKEYGVKENGDAHMNAGGAPPAGQNWSEQVAAKRKEIAALETRMHTADEKQRLTDDLYKLYVNKPKG